MKKTITAGVAALALTLTACSEDSATNAAPTIEEAMTYEYVEAAHDGAHIYREPGTDNHHLCIMYGEAPGYEFVTDTGCSEAMSYDGVIESMMASWDSAFESMEPPTQPAPTGPVDAELGETVTLVQDANGPREVHLTINEISVSETCHHGLNGHTEPTEDGGYYIQMTGEMEAMEGDRGYSLSEMWMTGTTEDGYAVEFTPAFPCENPDLDGYQSFENSVIPGQKARGVLEFWSSDMPETITLLEPYEPVDYRWTVPAAQ